MNPPPQSSSATRWRGAGAAVLAIAALFVVAHRGEAAGAVRTVLAAVEELGAWGPAVFVGIYVVAAVLLVPASVLTISAGALFGVVAGSAYVSLASTIGAALAFVLGRHLARDWVAARIAGRPGFEAVDAAVAREGWKIVFLTRLSPLFPFNFLNYAFGLTRVRFRDYVLASWLGMLPATVLYVYLGAVGRAVAQGSERSNIEWIAYGVGLAATIAATVVTTRAARRALEGRLAPSSGTSGRG